MSTLQPNNSLFFFPSNDLPRRTVESLPSLITTSENTTRNSSFTHLPEEEITVRTPLVNGRAYTYYTYTKEGLPVEAEDKIPDGGLRAWLVVLGAFLNFCTSFGVTNSFGTFQNYYDSHMKLSSDRSAWIGSLQLAILLLGGIVVGPVFDKRGSRILMIPGALIVLVSFLINIFTQDFIALVIAQGVLCGIGNGLLFHPAISAVSEWFDKRRALALGLAISGSSIGGVFWPILVNILLKCFGETDPSSDKPDASRALKWTFTVMLAISAPLLAIACCLVRERIPRAQRNAGRKLTEKTEMPLPRLLRSCFSRQQIALTVALFLIYLGYLIPFSYIPLFAKEQGINESMQNALLAICYAGSVFGRILPSWLGDKYGRFNVLILMSLITGVITFSWPFMTTLPTLIAFSILFGFVSGGLMPLGSACVAQISPDLEHIGFRLGMAMAICSVGVLAGGPISGQLWEMYFDESGMQFFAGGATILGAVVLTVARFLSRREVLVAF